MNRHRMNAKNPNLKAVHWKKYQLEKFAHDFAEIYNKAWANHGEGKQIEAKKVLKMFQTMKPILDEKSLGSFMKMINRLRCGLTFQI